MSPEQFIKTSKRIYGHKHWKAMLARDIGVHHTTIHRLAARKQDVPGPYEVALLAMLANHIRQLEINRAARSLLRQRKGKLMPLPKRKPRTPRSAKPLGSESRSCLPHRTRFARR